MYWVTSDKLDFGTYARTSLYAHVVQEELVKDGGDDAKIFWECTDGRLILLEEFLEEVRLYQLSIN